MQFVHVMTYILSKSACKSVQTLYSLHAAATCLLLGMSLFVGLDDKCSTAFRKLWSRSILPKTYGAFITTAGYLVGVCSHMHTASPSPCALCFAQDLQGKKKKKKAILGRFWRVSVS